MKTVKQIIRTATLLLIATNTINAQDQMYFIHSDYVKPSMQSEYIQVSKELVAACKKHNIQNADWMCNRSDEGVYYSIAPIKNLAELDIDTFLPLAEKMGKENLDAIWDRFNKCYDRHNSYILTLKKDLSFMPNGITLQTEGENYRKHHYFYITPANTKIVSEKIKAITTLYTKKNSKVHYRIYQSGFGTVEDYFLVSISAKNEEEYAKRAEENRILLGDEGKTLLNDLYKNIKRYDVKTAMMQNDLGYTATK
jgi:hypothetical protein